MPVWGWVGLAVLVLVALAILVVIPRFMALGREGNLDKLAYALADFLVDVENVVTRSSEEVQSGMIDMATLEHRLQLIQAGEATVYTIARENYFPDDIPEVQSAVKQTREYQRQMEAIVERAKG